MNPVHLDIEWEGKPADQLLTSAILKPDSCDGVDHFNHDDDHEDNEPLSKFITGTGTDLRYPCTRCTFVTEDKGCLESHTRDQHDDFNNLFKRSSRRTYDKQTRLELNTAKVKVKGKVQYQCKICNQYLTSAYGFVTHKTIHSGQKLFPCHICGRKFRLLGFLKNHLRHIHSMNNKHDLKDYQDSKSASDLKDSVRKGERRYLDYKAIEKVKVIHNGAVFYRCEICSKELTRVNYYISHMSIHTGEKKFICHLCGKRFRLAPMLKVHVKLTHERIKNYNCEVCGQKFGTSTNLAEHRHTHTGERPHTCPQCGKSYKQRSALFVHSRVHSDHFPFKCMHCARKFKIQSLLRYHMAQHTGEQPFTCELCGKGFPIKSHLNQHMKIHVEERPYTCSQCDKGFRHKKNLKVHLKNCHGIEML